MQSDEFATKQVLAGRNALGNGDCLDAFVCNEAVDAPFGAVEGVLGDLSCLYQHCVLHVFRRRGECDVP
jgi:hypothetical protein